MITFCTGNITAKRRAFRSMNGDGVINVDNDEIIATFSLDKKLYSVVGDIPYSNMSLEQYIACTRALITRLPLSRSSIKTMLNGAGLKISPKKRLKKLSRVQYRAASLVSKIDATTKTVFVNFDGLEYSSKHNKQLNKFLTRWGKMYEVFVAVSDTRFIPSKAPVLNYSAEGITSTKGKQKSRKTQKGKLVKQLKQLGMDITLPPIKKVIRCAE